MTTDTTATADTPTPDTTQPKVQKTSAITLTAPGARLTLLAVRRTEGAETFATTTDLATKKSTRGMTTRHATFEAACAALKVQAAKAQKLGWVRRAPGRGFAARPDAFTELPAPPKAAKK
jgi:hypothetical protein